MLQANRLINKIQQVVAKDDWQMATSGGINTGYEPTKADLCITKSCQGDQVMGITIMVQTKKEFIIIPKCTIAMLSTHIFIKNCCQTHMSIFFPVLTTAK